MAVSSRTPSRTPGPIRHRLVRVGAVSLAATAVVAVAGYAVAGGDSSGADNSASAKSKVKPTVVLVHGAFADASGWNAVVDRLQAQGYPVLAPPNPLRGVLSDSAYVASVLKSVKGPIVLAGHSYGGAVISQAAAGNPNVKALVYVAAFMPDVGENPAALSGKFTGSELGPAIRPVPYSDGTATGTDLYIKEDKFHSVFAADLTKAQARVMAVEQRPVAQAGFAQNATKAAWKTIPSWFIVAKNDKAIAPNLERFQAKRAKSHVVEIDSSHVAMMSHPDVVVEKIHEAAGHGGGHGGGK
ncbi:alpha/beta hydrolase [Streptomyces sp. NPDC059477]|uniref:alpha/beta hydrolase n=1 Tax=Streptomyces sp. NPDC059477 TaxID=3346847 RepID=UPI0036A98767